MRFSIFMLSLLTTLVKWLSIITVTCVIMLTIMACMFTPNKTDDGLFTDPIKYWISDTYYCDHFNDTKYCGKGE